MTGNSPQIKRRVYKLDKGQLRFERAELTRAAGSNTFDVTLTLKETNTATTEIYRLTLARHGQKVVIAKDALPRPE